jgi:uncharacterized membrane protein YdjX (TVP38/TMEM64 family)
MQETPPAQAPTRNWLRWLVLAILLAGVVGFYALGLHNYLGWDYLRANIDAFKTHVEGEIVLALLIFFVIYAILSALSVPAAWVMTLVAGALFGRVLGAGASLLAATIGATLAFLSSRFLLRDWVQARFGSRLEAFNRGFEKDGAFYLFSLRLVPLFPFFVINLAMGLTPIRTWTYFWVSLVGMLPGSLLYANAGYQLGRLEKPSDIMTPELIVAFVLMGTAPLVFRKLVGWLSRRRATADQS